MVLTGCPCTQLVMPMWFSLWSDSSRRICGSGSFPQKDLTSVSRPLKKNMNVIPLTLCHKHKFWTIKTVLCNSCLCLFALVTKWKSLPRPWGTGINKIRRLLHQAAFKWPLDWDTIELFWSVFLTLCFIFDMLNQALKWYTQVSSTFFSTSQSQPRSFSVYGRCPGTRQKAVWWYVFIHMQPFHFSSNLI